VFWLAASVCTIYYSAIFPFQSTATALLETTHKLPEETAAFYISILPLTSFVLSPIFGFIIDKIARRVYFLCIGLAIMTPAFALLMTANWPPILSMVAIGLVFALVPAAIWPCLPLLIDERHTGTAFGILSGWINAGLTLVYYLQGNIPDQGTKATEVLLFASLSGIGFFLSIFWNILDWRMGGICNDIKPADEKRSTESNSR